MSRQETLRKYNASEKRKRNSRAYEASQKGIEVRRRSRRKRMQALRDRYGGCCEHCHTTECLQFAHIKPTACKGMKGGGGHARLIDIRENFHSYSLLCIGCHRKIGGPEGWKDRSILRIVLRNKYRRARWQESVRRQL